MFKKSVENQQLDMFSSPGEHLRGSKMNYYLKNDSWHNLFRNQVVMRIDESIFSVLFCDDNGAPNVSIRVLIGMMILKEAHGWSDQQLFESSNFNILTRSALGLMSLTDAIPAESTYYLFRHKMVKYNKLNDTDLLKACFEQITHMQILEFDVSGKQVRMDSKLMGSNIAWLSRYELIHETLRMFIKEREEYIYKKSLSKDEFALIKSIQAEKGNKVVYRSTKSEVESKIVTLGKLMYRFVVLFKGNQYGEYKTLKALFHEQFSVGKDKVVLPLEKEKISAKSIQSPHDTDADYRNKDGNQVKGYSINLTETCDKPSDSDKPVLNLITDIQVNVVSTQDNTFVKSAITNTQQILPNQIETVYTDGAYNSAENQEFCTENNIDLLMPTIQGTLPRYDISIDENDSNNLIVIDNKTGEQLHAKQISTRKNPELKKWRIITDDGKYRYFDDECVRVADLRKKLKDIPIEDHFIRHNVEASIFQLGFHYPNDKSRYRTLAKQALWAYSRALWINLVRIKNYVTQICQRSLFLCKAQLNTVNICFDMQILKLAYAA